MAKKWLIFAVFSLVVVGGVAGCHDSTSPDPAVARLEQLRDAELPRLEQMTETERDASRAKLRQQLDGMSKEQRRAFFENSGTMFTKALVRDVDRILALPADEQRNELDRKIDELRARKAAAPNDPAPVDPKRAEEMRNRVLGTLSAEDRQKFGTYRSKLIERMKERGLPQDTELF